MDDFVRRKLSEWGFPDLIDKFQDEGIDKEKLFCLEEDEFVRLIPKIGPRAKFKKQLQKLKSEQMSPQEVNSETVCPSSSTSSENEQHDQRDRPAKKPRQSDTPAGSTKDLSADTKELVGVFGKTGAGKSSLINAIVQERDLLPTGSLTACTSVMIKVEANSNSSKYEAEIEFISTEDWKDELWSVQNLYGNEDMEEEGDSPEEKDEDEEYNDKIEKMTALYGEEWKIKSENLMEDKYFKDEIPEFLQSGRKTLEGESAKDLSTKVHKYTRNEVNGGRCFWPLVKCVTLRVPNNKLLEHVTLVDLPGNGDRNKSRDQMWTTVVASCSVVWIVSDINRAVADRDAWDILKRACGLMGNGGQCQNIYFICTKSDCVGEDGSTSARHILNINSKAKDLVRKEFNKLNKVKKQFKDDCFDVFTVSSKEFLKPKYLKLDETEIPRLQEHLRSLNDQHDLTLNYVSGAHGILSLIEGAKPTNVEPAQSAVVCKKLKGIIDRELQKVQRSMEDVHEEFEKCLRTGVEESKQSCEEALNKALNPKTRPGRRKGFGGFHKQLKSALQNEGVYNSKKKQINLNKTLSNYLTDSIDEVFRKYFPNDLSLEKSFYGKIHDFSLNTTELVQEYKHFELLLTFLKTEEAAMKTKLCKDSRDRKKIIYHCLMKSVTETMQECYTRAGTISGTGSFRKMQDEIQEHFRNVKDTMFDRAKDEMLSQLKDHAEEVQKRLGDSLWESIEQAFQSGDRSIPDFGKEFALVKKHYDDLMVPRGRFP